MSGTPSWATVHAKTAFIYVDWASKHPVVGLGARREVRSGSSPQRQMGPDVAQLKKRRLHHRPELCEHFELYHHTAKVSPHRSKKSEELESEETSSPCFREFVVRSVVYFVLMCCLQLVELYFECAFCGQNLSAFCCAKNYGAICRRSHFP